MEMKIKHILADGTELDDITGYIVKPEENPEVYKILASILKRRIQKCQPEE